MIPPEVQLKLDQHRNEFDEVYGLLKKTDATVKQIATTQELHGRRLDDMQGTLDVTLGKVGDLSTKLGETNMRIGLVESKTDRLAGRMDRLEDTQRKHSSKLDEILAILRDRRQN